MSLGCTDEQRAAIEASVENPVAIVACPGSGKTFTVIHRVAHLLRHGFAAKDILVITFTRKASQELKQRLKSMGLDVRELTVRTFHSFGLSVLRKFAHLLNMHNFSIISQAEQLDLLTEMSGKRLSKDVLLQLQKYKSGGTVPDDIKQLFEKYTTRIRSIRSCDYTDLIVLPLELMQRNKEVLEFYQRRFKYGLVDEMQDVSKVQFELVKLMFGDLGKLTVVGDDDQTIYGWRGADARLLLDFQTVFPNAVVIRLTKCFRCAPHIVRAMSAVIKCNKIRVEKSITSLSPEKTLTQKKIIVYGTASLRLEAEVILDDISRRLGKGSIAVLFRQRKALQAFKDELKNRNIQAIFADKARFLESRDVIRILNILQMCAGLSYNDKCFTATDIDKIRSSLKTDENVKDCVSRMSVCDAVKTVVEGLQIRNENVEFLLEEAENCKDSSLVEFLDLVRTASEQQSGPNVGIHLSTVHQAKGLEWDFVYVIGATVGRWPSRRTDEARMEEERRLFYVAMSRARKELTISCLVEPGPSPFLCEIPELLVDERIETEEKPKPKKEPPKKQFSGFQSVSSMKKT